MNDFPKNDIYNNDEASDGFERLIRRSFGHRFRYILIDLDGTLTEPFEGISKSIIYALADQGIKVEDPRELRSFIGPPLFEQFMAQFELDEERAAQAVKKYRERYSEIGWKECTLTDGAEYMLKSFKEKGKTVALATSKPEVFAKRILEHFGIEKYFDFIGGAELDPKGRNSKLDIIEYTLENIGAEDRDQALMIGDRFYDITAAQKAGIHQMGVLTGYGSWEEFEEYGAEFIADDLTNAANGLL